MKRFLAVYLGAPAQMEEWNKLPATVQAERQAAGIRAWHAWVTRHHDKIVDMGGPLGKTKAISAKGIADVRNAMTGYTVILAHSQEEAAELFEGHPHFSIFPGDSVELMECLPLPANSEA
jgi:hypothetical protein